MDFIANLIEQVQKTGLFKILQSFAVLDWIVVFLVLWGMLQGGRKGFGFMLGKVAEILLIGILTLTLYPKLSVFLRQIVSALPENAADIIGFLMVSLLTGVVVMWCFNNLGKFLKVEISGSLKTLGGILGGGLYFFLLLSLVSQFLLLLPVPLIDRAYKKGHSYTGPVLAAAMPTVQQVVVSLSRFKKKTVEVLPKTD